MYKALTIIWAKNKFFENVLKFTTHCNQLNIKEDYIRLYSAFLNYHYIRWVYFKNRKYLKSNYFHSIPSKYDLFIETLGLQLFDYIPSIFELNHQVIFKLDALNTRKDMNKNNFIPTNITLHDVFCTMSWLSTNLTTSIWSIIYLSKSDQCTHSCTFHLVIKCLKIQDSFQGWNGWT